MRDRLAGGLKKHKLKLMLRDYQTEMVERVHDAWRRGVRSVMVQMPTGTGKTWVMAEIMKAYTDRRTDCVLVVAHRRELIEQVRQTLEAFGIEGRETTRVDGESLNGQGQTVYVESIQRLSRHIDETVIEPTLIVIDEAHHAQAQTYRMLWERWPQARFLGLTATPCRMNGEGFTDLFELLVCSHSIQEFITRGWLSDFEYVSARPDSMMMRQVRSLTRRGADGDYQTREMAAVMDTEESTKHLFDTYNIYTRGKKGIVYAIDKAHAQHISEYYSAHGVRSQWIEARTPARERERLVDAYRRGEVDVLVNVDIFSEGFDCPEVEFIQLARPTLSLSKYMQQVGRGMRVSQGKPHVVILDNVGLYQTFGLPTVERDWSRMFQGQEVGKGRSDISRMVVVNSTMDKELDALEMVRIKRAGERCTGLEVFIEDGRYGVMRGGKVTCPAKFKRVERLQKGCGFFALGIYSRRNERELGKIETVTTVIDRYGRDLQVQLLGDVWWTNGYFYGRLNGGTFMLVNCWDPIGNAYYDTDPQFMKVAGVEVGYAHEHNSWNMECLRLRKSTGKVSPRFNEWEMFYNKYIIIARDYLVVKHDHNHSYRISGYLDDSVLVESDVQYGYQQIMLNGEMGQHFNHLPAGVSRALNHRRLGLQRVKHT